MPSIFEPIKGKCQWWREMPNQDDIFDPRLMPEERRIMCHCFVEGKGWEVRAGEMPDDCPEAFRCRYYIKVS